MEALGRRGIAPTKSRPRLSMGVNGQRQAPAALYLQGKAPPVPTVQEAGWAPEPVWTQRLEEKFLCPCRGSNHYRPVVQSVAIHYTDWATPALNNNSIQLFILCAASTAKRSITDTAQNIRLRNFNLNYCNNKYYHHHHYYYYYYYYYYSD
jgi:hypothetical protein